MPTLSQKYLHHFDVYLLIFVLLCHNDFFCMTGRTHKKTHTSVCKWALWVNCQACESGEVLSHSNLTVRGLSVVWTDGEEGGGAG